jgi:hypothetical protein
MLLTVLNSVFIVTILVAVMILTMFNRCSKYSPIPTEEELVNTSVLATAEYVNALNIISNIVIVIAGLAVLTLGFPLEGCIYLLTAVFSMLWHASGETHWGVLDHIFASLSFIVVTLMYFRIVQVAGWPLLSPFYLSLPILGALAFGSIQQNTTSDYLRDRVSHVSWHVLSGAAFLIVALEYARVPSLVPNRAVRTELFQRQRRLWTRKYRPEPYWSAVVGLFRDLKEKQGTG